MLNYAFVSFLCFMHLYVVFKVKKKKMGRLKVRIYFEE